MFMLFGASFACSFHFNHRYYYCFDAVKVRIVFQKNNLCTGYGYKEVYFKLLHRHCELRSSEAIQNNYELLITGNL